MSVFLESIFLVIHLYCVLERYCSQSGLENLKTITGSSPQVGGEGRGEQAGLGREIIVEAREGRKVRWEVLGALK